MVFKIIVKGSSPFSIVIKGYGEMVDTQDLGPCGKKNTVWVQVPLSSNIKL